MTLQEFRIAHSTIIEHYQFIEMHLEGIYACLNKKGFFSGLKDVELSNINKIIEMIKKQDDKNTKKVFSNSEYEDLKSICQRRNFWTHDCYTKMTFDIKTAGPKKEIDIKQLNHDISVAENIRAILYNRKMTLMDEPKRI